MRRPGSWKRSIAVLALLSHSALSQGDGRSTAVDEQIAKMRAQLAVSQTLAEKARRAKDLVKLECINDKLIQIKGFLKLSAEARAALRSDDPAERQHQRTKVKIASERVAVLGVEAEHCIGELRAEPGTDRPRAGRKEIGQRKAAPAAGRRRYKGRRIDLSFKQASLANVFLLLAEVGAQRIEVSPQVTAKVDLQLENTPWDQVLDDLIQAHGVKKVKIGAVLYLCPAAEAGRKLRFQPPWPRRRRLRGSLELRGIRITDALRLALAGEKRTVLVGRSISGRTRLSLRNTHRNDLLAVLLRKAGLELTASSKELRIAPPGSSSGELGPLDKLAALETLIYYCRNSLRAAKNADFGCGLPAALGKLRLRGVLSLIPSTAWAAIEDERGNAAIIRRGDRVGDAAVQRILREAVILRRASGREEVLKFPEAAAVEMR